MTLSPDRKRAEEKGSINAQFSSKRWSAGHAANTVIDRLSARIGGIVKEDGILDIHAAREGRPAGTMDGAQDIKGVAGEMIGGDLSPQVLRCHAEPANPPRAASSTGDATASADPVVIEVPQQQPPRARMRSTARSMGSRTSSAPSLMAR